MRALRVRSNGAELHCVVDGSGPPLVVVGCIGSRYLETGLANLSDDLQLVFIELRGTGRSSGSIEELDIDLVLDDVDLVRRHLNLDRVAILGHSINGQFALAFAARYPEAASHVICVGTPPPGDHSAASAGYFEEHAPAELRAARDRLVELERAGASQDLASQAWARFDRLRRWHDRRFDPGPLETLYDVRQEWMRRVIGELLPAYMREKRMAEIASPVLLAMGSSDFVVPPVVWDRGSRPPRTTLEIFERSAHTPFVEEPDEFRERLLGWLGRETRVSSHQPS